MLPSRADRRRSRQRRLALAALAAAVAAASLQLVWVAITLLTGATLLAIEATIPRALPVPATPATGRRREDRIEAEVPLRAVEDAAPRAAADAVAPRGTETHEERRAAEA
jgi:hypothetical protein